jgi:raffinose/stachyose/melibiose transport system substrate-binding protein
MMIDTANGLINFKNNMEKLSSGQEITSGEETISGVQQFEIGSFNMPSMEGEGIEAPARTIEVPIGFLGAIKKDKAHDDLVVDFLMYYSSQEGYGKYMEAGLDNGWIPNGPPIVHGVQLPEEYSNIFNQLEMIGNIQKGGGYFVARGAPFDIQESFREWYQYTGDFMKDQITIDDWAEKQRANVKKYIPDSLKAAGFNESDLDNPQNEPTGN